MLGYFHSLPGNPVHWLLMTRVINSLFEWEISSWVSLHYIHFGTFYIWSICNINIFSWISFLTDGKSVKSRWRNLLCEITIYNMWNELVSETKVYKSRTKLSCVIEKCASRSLSLSYTKKDWLAGPCKSFFGSDTNYKIVFYCHHRLYSTCCRWCLTKRRIRPYPPFPVFDTTTTKILRPPPGVHSDDW